MANADGPAASLIGKLDVSQFATSVQLRLQQRYCTAAPGTSRRPPRHTGVPAAATRSGTPRRRSRTPSTLVLHRFEVCAPYRRGSSWPSRAGAVRAGAGSTVGVLAPRITVAPPTSAPVPPMLSGSSIGRSRAAMARTVGNSNTPLIKALMPRLHRSCGSLALGTGRVNHHHLFSLLRPRRRRRRNSVSAIAGSRENYSCSYQ